MSHIYKTSINNFHMMKVQDESEYLIRIKSYTDPKWVEEKFGRFYVGVK